MTHATSSPIVPSPEQQAVIDHPLAPLRVAAGAGTGKTTTMALRLARLISDGLVAPEQALGVTFTRKATRELADRIAAALPGYTAEGRAVDVTTYHGFAHQLLSEFGPLVGTERDAKLITPGYARQLLRDSLGTGVFNALDLTAPGHRVADLARLDGQLGDHLADPDVLASNVFASGEVEERRRELARALVEYGKLKQRLGVVDYPDLIRLACRLVDEHPAIAERIRHRYGVVLLDEYQDTNPAQRRLFMSLFGNGFPVTAVGDSDQTIYEWRGASLANFEDFPTDFAPSPGELAPTRSLTLNRRSGDAILNLANDVRAKMTDGADREGALRAVPATPPGTINTAWFRTPEQEARWIAGEARRLHDEEGFPWSGIAVLFRRNSSIPVVRDALEAADIPTEVASLGGLLFVPEVADLHAWLRLVGRPDDAPALVRILMGAHFRLGLGDLMPLARWVRRRIGGSDEDARPWVLLEAVEALDDIDDLRPEARVALERFSGVYRELLESAQSTTLVELCRRILGRLGFWVEVAALDGSARLSARLNLYRFLDLAEEWSPLVGRPSLDAFLDYLDLLLEDDTAEELDTAQLSTEDAVALLTVHRAKGLEWDAVFVPAVCKKVFPVEGRPADNPVTSPSRLPFSLRTNASDLAVTQHDPKALSAALRRQHLDQEWRVAYVAVTRARSYLAVSGAFWHSPKTPKEPSELFELAVAQPGRVVHHHEPEAGEAPATAEFQPALRTSPPDPHFSGGWDFVLRMADATPDRIEELGAALGPSYDAQVDQIRMTLDGLPEAAASADNEQFVTSVTSLVTLAACPKRYYWSDIDRLPRRPAGWLKRGVEFHRKVELHNLGIIPLEEITETSYDAVETDGDETDASATDRRRTDLQDPSKRAADAYTAFLSSRFASARPRFVEVPIDVKVGDGRIRGRIDAIYEPEPGTWEIVDYKSGRAGPDDARRVQLQAYAVAADDGALPVPAPDRLGVTFAFFGGGEAEEIHEPLDEDWLEAARIKLAELMDQAMGDTFEPTPSASCRTCDFVRFCPEGTAYLAGR